MFAKSSKEIFPSTFDETALEINCKHGKTQLQEIKVSYNWLGGNIKSRLPILNCQWFNKTEESMDLIEGVNEEMYQPSILDVGKMVYIQIVPQSKDMEYIGMPITKLIGPLALSSSTEEQVNQLIEAQKSTFFVESKQLKLSINGKMTEITAKDTLLKIIKHKISLMGKNNTTDKAESLISISITSQYPKIIINRKNSKQVQIHFDQKQRATILFQGNKIRDVFFLLVEKIKKIVEENGQTEEKEDEKVEIKSQTSITQENPFQSEESLAKSEKSEQRLPLSPQSQDLPKQQQKQQIHQEGKIQQEPPEAKLDRNNNLGNAQLLNISQNFQLLKEKLEEQNLKINESRLKLQNQMSKLIIEKIAIQEQACYHKNQGRILKDDLELEQKKSNELLTRIQQLQKMTSISIPEISKDKYGHYLNLNYQDLLEQLMKKDGELQELKCKNNYQTQRLDAAENQVKTLSFEIQNNQDTIKKLQKKIETLNDSKKMMADHLKTENTRTHQIGQYEFQIGKLKEEINIFKESSKLDNEAKDKQIQSSKIQVKQLIQQNTYLRSKEKSSKGELKNEIVELKKLVNRFAESITEKDMQIEQLKYTNKQLNKQLVRRMEEKND